MAFEESLLKKTLNEKDQHFDNYSIQFTLNMMR